MLLLLSRTLAPVVLLEFLQLFLELVLPVILMPMFSTINETNYLDLILVKYAGQQYPAQDTDQKFTAVYFAVIID
jgi:hypothetical protein